MDFLTLRSQQVRVDGILSDVLFSSTGSPQDCVFFPLSYLCCSLPSAEAIKVGITLLNLLMTQSLCLSSTVRIPTTAQCQWNVSLSKYLRPGGIVIDFQEQPLCYLSTEQVEQHKYLGTITDDKLTFEQHVNAVCKRKKKISAVLMLPAL